MGAPHEQIPIAERATYLRGELEAIARGPGVGAADGSSSVNIAGELGGSMQ
jgi:hypothetical protein